jgi:hypothetical protein
MALITTPPLRQAALFLSMPRHCHYFAIEFSLMPPFRHIIDILRHYFALAE